MRRTLCETTRSEVLQQPGKRHRLAVAIGKARRPLITLVAQQLRRVLGFVGDDDDRWAALLPGRGRVSGQATQQLAPRLHVPAGRAAASTRLVVQEVVVGRKQVDGLNSAGKVPARMQCGGHVTSVGRVHRAGDDHDASRVVEHPVRSSGGSGGSGGGGSGSGGSGGSGSGSAGQPRGRARSRAKLDREGAQTIENTRSVPGSAGSYAGFPLRGGPRRSPSRARSRG